MARLKNEKAALTIQMMDLSTSLEAAREHIEASSSFERQLAEVCFNASSILVHMA